MARQHRQRYPTVTCKANRDAHWLGKAPRSHEASPLAGCRMAEGQRMAIMKLKRLKIKKYRNVDPMELRFNDGLNVLLGQNGAGKTTLLRLVAMAASSD